MMCSVQKSESEPEMNVFCFCLVFFFSERALKCVVCGYFGDVELTLDGR